GVGGRTITDFDGAAEKAAALVVQPDGKLVTAGSSASTVENGPFVVTTTGFALVRYQPDGSLDPAFGDGGRVLTEFDVLDEHGLRTSEASTLIVQPDGKLVAAGYVAVVPRCADSICDASDLAIARYNSDGTLDETFGSAGTITSTMSDEADDLIRQPDGKLVVVGSTARVEVVLIRYNVDGSLDETFGTGGIVMTGTGVGFPRKLALQGDGKIIVAGTTGPPSHDILAGSLFGMLRYTADGELDDTFGTGGM